MLIGVILASLSIFLFECEGKKGKQYGYNDDSNTYDFIVVGAGTAGSIIASDLAINFPNKDILLIEEGSFSSVHPNIIDASKYRELLFDVTIERFYSTTEENLFGRTIELPRAKVTGGSNAHNGQNYRLFHENDFNRWGNIPGWSLDEMLDIWENDIESVNPGIQYDINNPLMQRWKNAAELNGYPFNPNNNDIRNSTQEGGSPLITQSNIVNISYTQRRTAWTDFMEPILPRDNLDILILTRVNEILLSSKSNNNGKGKGKGKGKGQRKGKSGGDGTITYTASGVETINLGTNEVINYYARKEVIISAGVYDTPKLLMLSGIGDCNMLKQQFTDDELSCIVDIPGVGKNLQDHIALQSAAYGITPPLNFQLFTEIDPLLLAGSTAVYGFVSISDGGDMAHTSVVVDTATVIALGLDEIVPDNINLDDNPLFLAIISEINRLTSTGNVTLLDSDPNSKPIINHNYLDTLHDQLMMIESIKQARNLIYNDAFSDYINITSREFEVLPGLSFQSDIELLQYGIFAMRTAYHPAGTSKMVEDFNNDPMGVVDSQLKVKNIKNLRIADASIMPVVVSANTNQMTMIIAKKAAQLITNDN